MRRAAGTSAWLIPALAASLGVASAQTPAVKPTAKATLDRPETPVIVSGARLKPLLKVPRDQLRVYAWKGGTLQPVPFQLDERTPEARYAFTKGEERRSDTDDGRIDANDELVFMARDAGPRVAVKEIRLGQDAAHELVVRDKGGKRAWLYLLRFRSAPPPPTKRTYLGLTWRKGELVGWSGSRVRVESPASAGNFLAFQQIRFRRAKGWGPDVLDRSKLSLKANYLYLNIRRRLDEVRAHVTSYLAGPVRAVAGYQLETYLIWGHWVRTTRKRSLLKVYSNRLELSGEVVLPVALEKAAKKKSRVRFSLDFSPNAGGVRVWSDKNKKPLHADGKQGKLARLWKRDKPAWVCAAFPSGSILARLALGGDLRKRPWSLYLKDEPSRDPPEDLPGSLGNVGFELDLTGLAKGTYGFRLSLSFGPPLSGPGDEKRLLRVEDAPLEAALTKKP